MTELFRKLSHNILNQIAKILSSLGIPANLITILGLLGHISSAILIAKGQLLLGGLLVLVFGLFDAIDGALARYNNEENLFGAFLDSVSDRISEIFIFSGILVFFIGKTSFTGTFLVFCAAVTSLMVSYCRSRAESIGEIVRIGLLTRVERYMIIVFSLIFQKLEIGLIVVTILSSITFCQRVWYVYNHRK